MLRRFLTIKVTDIDNIPSGRQPAPNQPVANPTQRSPVEATKCLYCITEITNRAIDFVREPLLRKSTQHTVGASAGDGVHVAKGPPSEGFESGISKHRGKLGLYANSVKYTGYSPRKGTSAHGDLRLARSNNASTLKCVYLDLHFVLAVLFH